MRILVISTWHPFPPDNGSRIRAYYLLRGLAEQHQVTLVSFRPETGPLAQDGHQGTEMPEWGIEQVTVDEDPFRHVDAPRAVKYLSPIPMAFIRSRKMDRQVERLAKCGAWDAVVALQTPAARYALNLDNSAKVLDFDAPLMAQMHQRFRDSHGSSRALRWGSWQKAKRFEQSVARRFDMCTVVSHQDLVLAQEVLAGSNTGVSVSPNGVDCDRHKPESRQSEPYTLVYNGAMTYSANYDAVRFFLRDVYPQVKEALPQVSFRVTGSTKGVMLDDLNLDESIVLTGYVDDIRTEVAGATLCVIPLRKGGGTRLKILEAMALGTAVVSTSKGAEGLAVADGIHLLIADGPADFAGQIVRLLRDGGLRRQLAENGRRLVEQRYDWRSIGRAYVDVVERASLAKKGA
jgi:glycosyltransferase involved in cell wall biosynthesis